MRFGRVNGRVAPQPVPRFLVIINISQLSRGAVSRSVGLIKARVPARNAAERQGRDREFERRRGMTSGGLAEGWRDRDVEPRPSNREAVRR